MVIGPKGNGYWSIVRKVIGPEGQQSIGSLVIVRRVFSPKGRYSDVLSMVLRVIGPNDQ